MSKHGKQRVMDTIEPEAPADYKNTYVLIAADLRQEQRQRHTQECREKFPGAMVEVEVRLDRLQDFHQVITAIVRKPVMQNVSGRKGLSAEGPLEFSEPILCSDYWNEAVEGGIVERGPFLSAMGKVAIPLAVKNKALEENKLRIGG